MSNLLALDSATYSSRLSGKTVLLTDLPSGPSELVTGRKRNRGDESALRATKAASAAAAAEREAKGVMAPRKAARLREQRCATSPRDPISYASLAPLRTLHERYLAHVLALPTWSEDGSLAAGDMKVPVAPEPLQGKLLKVDLTGAVLSVLAAKNASLVGLRGTVLEETEGTFRLACADDRVRVVPKAGAQLLLSFPAFAYPVAPREPEDEAALLQRFHAQCPRIEVEIMGSAFAFRSGDRAGRKFRPAQGRNGSGWGEDWVKGEWGQLLGGLGEDVGQQARRQRKRNKSRRKDPLVGGSTLVV